MPAELDDEKAFKRALREATGEISSEEIRDAVEQAARYANEAFERAASDPPEGASLDEWHLEPIIESLEIRRVRGESEGALAQGDAWVAEWTHPHTNKMEVGVQPHHIEGDPVLVWEDRETGETIFRQEVDHPGNPGIGAIREGFQRVFEERFA
jgi:hypothetical protein